MNLRIFILFAAFIIGDRAMGDSFIHLHNSEPFFLFEVSAQKMWRLEKYSTTTLRFNPGKDVRVNFEVPPSLNIIPVSRIQSENVSVRDKNEGKNANGVSYKLVYLKGWETDAYLMTYGMNSLYVNNAVGEYTEYGLSGKKVFLEMRDSFMFLDVKKLSEQQLRKIILASSYKQNLIDSEKQLNSTKGFSVSDQPDKYVVSLKGMRGGPVFHVHKKDLTVTHHNER